MLLENKTEYSFMLRDDEEDSMIEVYDHGLGCVVISIESTGENVITTDDGKTSVIIGLDISQLKALVAALEVSTKTAELGLRARREVK
jgi:hypothetical protein